MRVLVADDDPVSRSVMTSVLEQSGYDVVAVSDGTQAFDATIGDDSIRIVVIDWVMPGMAGPDICRELRARPHAQYTYVIIVSGRSGQDAFQEGMESGADEFLTKPFDPRELVARVRVGERVLANQCGASSSVADVLREALSSSGGEVIVRSGAAVGRVHLSAGRVAWADLSTVPGSLLDVLEGAGAVSREDAASALAEARRSRRGFAEILVEWGLVDEARLRSWFRAWIGRKLEAICALEGASAIFVPGGHQTTSAMTFEFHEVCGQSLVSSRGFTPSGGISRAAGTDDELRAAVAAMMSVEGASASAVLSGDTGAVVWREGRELDRELIRDQLQLLGRVGFGRAGRELILTTNTEIHLICPIPKRGPLFLYVQLRADRALLAMARLSLGAAAESVSAPS